MNEKRRFSRIPFDAEARITGPGVDVTTQLLDISLKGVLIARPDNWQGKTGQRYTLELTLGSSGTVISMDIEIMHEEAARIGGQCTHIDLESISHLRRLVELNLGDEGILDRELHALIGQ